jgi:pimeloyl-ACP methyl ester carboxylesterase
MARILRSVAPLMLAMLAIGSLVDRASAQGLLRPAGFIFSDEVIYNGWRVQKNEAFGWYRLVDPQDNRVTRGSFETCLAALDKAKVDHKLPPLPEDVVIVLHGLGAPRSFMNGICRYLETQGGLYVVNFGYPSTMLTVEDYARSLDSVIRHLDGVKNISFVAHSMGNIVVRRYLKDFETLAPGMRPQVTFQRMVMISPPNHGAEIADMLGDREIVAKLADMVAGDVIKELAPKQGWPALERQLATPWFPFGIIAGGTGTGEGYLPQIPGDNDGLLSLETQKLAGAADFLQTGGLHQLMPNYEEVRAATLSFLKNGYFVSKDAMQPIPADPASTTTAPPQPASPTPAESLPAPAPQ